MEDREDGELIPSCLRIFRIFRIVLLRRLFGAVARTSIFFGDQQRRQIRRAAPVAWVEVRKLGEPRCAASTAAMTAAAAASAALAHPRDGHPIGQTSQFDGTGATPDCTPHKSPQAISKVVGYDVATSIARKVMAEACKLQLL